MAGVLHTIAQRRWLSAAIGACLLVIAGVGVVLVTSSRADDAKPSPKVRIASVSPSSTLPATTVVIQCDGPLDEHGNVGTGSSYSYRAPAGSAVPAGCHLA